MATFWALLGKLGNFLSHHLVTLQATATAFPWYLASPTASSWCTLCTWKEVRKQLFSHKGQVRFLHISFYCSKTPDSKSKDVCERAVVMAHWPEQSLPTPEVRGFHPVIGIICIEDLLTINCIEETKINLKGAGNGPLKRYL